MNSVTIGENITLYHGDCLEVIPTIKKGLVTTVVTDPPYKIISGGNKSGLMLGGIFDPKVYNNNGKIVGDCSAFTAWFPLLYELSDNIDIFTMCNDKNLRDMLNAAHSCGFKLHNVLLWDKGMFTPNRWFMKSVEFTCYFWKGRARVINNKGEKQLQSIKPTIGNRLHTTEKPVSLMEVYIRNASNYGDVILDPFMGSGTTGIAALNTNRKFIGIEKDENYFNIARERIEKAYGNE
jgi:site-specific DNA-methyltransferase (adenine-specific)